MQLSSQLLEVLRGIAIAANFKSHAFKELENSDHVAYRVAKAHAVCDRVDDAEALQNSPIILCWGKQTR